MTKTRSEEYKREECRRWLNRLPSQQSEEYQREETRRWLNRLPSQRQD